MSLKYKALLYNFLGYAILFILIRFFVVDYFALNHFVKLMIAAIVATLLAPKFAVVKAKEGSKLVMKWIFVKGFKEM
ncbi:MULTISPECIES: hypothetical protein [Cellulophaga]|uniref:hypothetical protein n=1 Tax=Cellulophaga TaxID=104264 RepID=UPI0020913BDD|nr:MULTISPECIES: hypothetical protein [Cellulophaga]MDO6768004.1 hypothetical protein [Cellulophaga sp. 1_MG-2023]